MASCSVYFQVQEHQVVWGSSLITTSYIFNPNDMPCSCCEKYVKVGIVEIMLRKYMKFLALALHIDVITVV